jgi:hypothetical protein
MNCPHCGQADLQTQDRVCPHCGKEVTPSPCTTNVTVEQTIGQQEGGKAIGLEIGQVSAGVVNIYTAPPSGTRPQPTPGTAAASFDKRALREAMIPAFSIADLEILCDDVEADLESDGVKLQVNLETVGGSSKPAQVLNLIQYLDRRGYLAYLVAAVRRVRPGII